MPESPRRFNAAAHFVDRHLLEGRGDRLALIAGTEHLTYAEVRARVDSAGSSLRALGVGRGDRVLLRLPDGPEFVASFWGAIKLGAVPVPLNTLLTPRDYEFIERDSGARVTVTPGSLPRGGSADLEPADTEWGDPCFWLYTSGTTGTPKAAVHLQHDMLVCCEAFGRHVLGIGPGDRCYSVAKLYFAYGLGNALYYPFGAGASAVLDPERFDPERSLEIIARERPTLFFAVPTAYAALLQVKDAERRFDLSSLRMCLSAGEPLPRAIFERWRARFGLEILDGIGTTELCNTFIANRPGRARPGSSGTLVPGYEARIVDDDGRDVADGTVGHLLVRGDSACAGYWNRPEVTRATLGDGWVRTGDKYSRDPDGYFWYAGRSDDMIKAGGQWVSPAEVEAALLEHPVVLEAGVIGAPDADELIKPVAFVVLRAAHAPSPGLEEELKAFVRERLPPFKLPRWIRFVSQLPRTATGKLQRYRLREQVSASDHTLTLGEV